MLFGAGRRRREAVSVQMDDYDPESGELTITGKTNRQRLIFATGGGKEAIEAWPADRCWHRSTRAAAYQLRATTG